VSKIDKLTPQQVARIPEWVKKWVDIGLSTEPANFEAATAAALKAYKFANLGAPMVVLRMGSPYAATIGGAYAWIILKNMFGAQVRAQVWAQVWAQVGDQVRDQVRAQVWDQVGAQVGDQVRDQVRAQVGAQVRAQVGAQVWDQVGAQVWDQVGAQVGDQVRDQVRAQVEAQVGDQVWDQVGAQQFKAAADGFNNYGINSLWCSWAAYVSFFRDVCGWNGSTLDRFEVDEALVKSCGWTWWHQNVLAISDRPSVINRDERGRLHCENAPSIAYRDGWKLYHVHGVLVPEYVIEHPIEITIPKIDAEQNAEVRRVMIDRYGKDRFLVDSGAEELHRDTFGILYRKNLKDDEPMVVVKVKNSSPEPDGSIKDYWLRVHPDCKTAQEAVAWTFGLKEKEYRPAVES
jgi:hypothetical protein